jgi:hypothetical protein
MAYFNHAFQKSFYVDTLTNYSGQLGTNGALTVGELAVFNAKTWAGITWANLDQNCCNIVIANGSLYQNDKIGKFHGGYLESNKSKEINAKYVSRLYQVTANAPQAMVVNVGSTPYTVDAGTANCCKEFLCGETYNLRLDVKGSPALRLLDHNSYLTVDAYTGCCDPDAIAPAPVDPRKVMLSWAEQIVNSPLMNPFIFPVVTYSNNNGTTWTLYYPNTFDVTTLPVIAGFTYANYEDWTEAAYANTMCAGLVLNGAYVDTKFLDCTFQISDFYEKEPVRIYASEVDLNGDPCLFTGICVVNECLGLQPNGLGETVAREMILSESYRQSFFATDLRIREITQGNQILDVIDRSALYDGVYLQHNVPRFNNPTGVFDNDQYLLAFYSLNGGTIASTLYGYLNDWLDACGSACNSEVFVAETDCVAVVPIAPGT